MCIYVLIIFSKKMFLMIQRDLFLIFIIILKIYIINLNFKKINVFFLRKSNKYFLNWVLHPYVSYKY